MQKTKSQLEKSIQQMKQLTNPKEDFVIKRLNTVPGVVTIQAVTEDNDPNGQLHKAGGYTSTVYFEHENVDQSEVYTSGSGDTVDKGTDGGGAVEVYENKADAEKRNDYLANFDGTVFASGSHLVAGTVIIRTSDLMTASQQQELEKNVLKALIRVE